MNRWILLFIALPAFLLIGFGTVYFVGFEELVGDEQNAGPQAGPQYAQLSTATSDAEEVDVAAKAPEPPIKPPAPAAAKPLGEAGKGPGWAVNCKSNARTKDLTCRMSQKVVARQTGRTLTDVAFVVPGPSESPELVLQLPLGLYLPAGVNYQVDRDTPRHLSFRMCNRRGCYAREPISPELWTKLRNGKQLKIDFKDSSEKPVSIAVSLDGLAFAHDKIQRP
jgi:invasion protein IalB